MKPTISLINHGKIIAAHDSKEKRAQEFLRNLYRNHKDTMTELFGKQTRVFTGSVRYWVWKVPFENETFVVFCSKRGTTYELEYPGTFEDFREDADIGDKCVRFLEYMLAKITSIRR